MAKKVICKSVRRPTLEDAGRTDVFEYTVGQGNELTDPVTLGYLINHRNVVGFRAFYQLADAETALDLGRYDERSQASHALHRHYKAENAPAPAAEVVSDEQPAQSSEELGDIESMVAAFVGEGGADESIQEPMELVAEAAAAVEASNAPAGEEESADDAQEGTEAPMTLAQALEHFNCSADALRKRVRRGSVSTVELAGETMYVR